MSRGGVGSGPASGFLRKARAQEVSMNLEQKTHYVQKTEFFPKAGRAINLKSGHLTSSARPSSGV